MSAISPSNVMKPNDDPVMISPGTTPTSIGGSVRTMMPKRRMLLNWLIKMSANIENDSGMAEANLRWDSVLSSCSPPYSIQ